MPDTILNICDSSWSSYYQITGTLWQKSYDHELSKVKKLECYKWTGWKYVDSSNVNVSKLNLDFIDNMNFPFKQS